MSWEDYWRANGKPDPERDKADAEAREQAIADPELAQAVNAALLGWMPRGLMAAIDELLAKGKSKAEILAFVRSRTGGPTAPRGGTTYNAVEAYLTTK